MRLLTIVQFTSSIFQPNICQIEFRLPGNGQPKSAGDDFVQDLAPPGQGVPSGTLLDLPEVHFVLDLLYMCRVTHISGIAVMEHS